MPREEIATERGRTLYDVLEALNEILGDFEAESGLLEWVNDNFETSEGDLRASGPEDWWIENARLGWK